MLHFLPSKKPAVPLTLALHIGSERVSAALFEESPPGRPRVLWIGQEAILFREEATASGLSSAMLRALDLCLIHAEKYGVRHIAATGRSGAAVSSVVFALSSPWHISEAKLLKLSRKNPEVVAKSAINELMAVEEKTLEERLRFSPKQKPEYALVESKILSIRLDGYPSSNPYGKKAREVEVLLFASVSPSAIFEKVKSALSKRFPESRIHSHTFILAAYAGIRDAFPETDDFIVMEVGGEVTDLAIVKKGLLLNAASLPLGENTLLRELLHICQGLPHCSAESLLSVHAGGEISAAEKKKVEQAIQKTKTDWLALFNAVISGFSEEAFLPGKVFLFADGPSAPVFEKFLKSAELGQFSLSGKPFAVEAAGPALARKFADHERKVAPAASLAVLANFAVRFK